jgi:type IV secretion system protein VirD4
MQYYFFALIAIVIIIIIIKKSIEQGWVFIVLGFAVGTVWLEFLPEIPAYILFFLSIAGGIWLMIWKIRRNKRKKSKEERTYIPPEMQSRTAHGFIFGVKNGEYIIKDKNKDGKVMDGNIMIIGGAGSGKSSCNIIPTLRAWQSPVFVIDIKGELYDTTKGYRANIRVFNPRNEKTCGYNPYFALNKSDNPVQEARRIAECLIPLPKKTEHAFWMKGARTILTASILHYYKDFSFVDTLKNIQLAGQKELILLLSKSEDENVKLCIKNFVDASDKTLSGFFLELGQTVEAIVTDKDLISALSREDNITPEDLEKNRDIYIVIEQEMISQWTNMLTLIVSQFLKVFEKRPAHKVTPILFLLDEFPELGQIQSIASGVATLRSRKIIIALAIQNLSQLDDVYGKDKRNIIVGNCSYKVILSAEDTETAEYFSKMVGTFDKPQKSKGKSMIPFLKIPIGENEHTTPVEKRRYKPEDFYSLPTRNILILVTPYGNFEIVKKPYYI